MVKIVSTSQGVCQQCLTMTAAFILIDLISFYSTHQLCLLVELDK
jgi:hypothetical protein